MGLGEAEGMAVVGAMTQGCGDMCISKHMGVVTGRPPKLERYTDVQNMALRQGQSEACAYSE